MILFIISFLLKIDYIVFTFVETDLFVLTFGPVITEVSHERIMQLIKIWLRSIFRKTKKNSMIRIYTKFSYYHFQSRFIFKSSPPRINPYNLLLFQRTRSRPEIVRSKVNQQSCQQWKGHILNFDSDRII